MQSVQTSASKRKIIIGIILMLGLCALSLLLPNTLLKSLPINQTNIFFISRLCIWVCVGLMVWFASSFEKTKFLLWQESKKSFAFYVLSVVSILLIIAAGSFIISYLLSHFFHFSNDSGKMKTMLSIFKENQWLMYFTVITAGITEELLFRGYLMPRLEMVLKSPLGSIVISSLVFGLSHATYGTIAQIIVPVYIGLVFAIFYYKYKNLKVLMLCHAIWDLVMLLGAIYSYK